MPGAGLGFHLAQFTGPGLLLHHPEAPSTDGAIKVVMKRRDVRMRSVPPAEALGFFEREGLGEADRIGVPRGEIKMRAERPVIEFVGEAHEIVGDPPAGRMTADDLALHAVIRRDLLGLESPKVEPRRRIGLRHREIGQRHFVEVLHLHRPERSSPRFVKPFRRLIAAPKPVAKSLEILRAPRQHGVVTAVFVVGLPAGQRRMAAVAPRQRLDDARAFAPIGRRREGIVPARTEAAPPALTVDRRDLRKLVDQPFGRGSGRRAEHDLQPSAAERADRPIEPLPLEVAASRLVAGPGKLADPHIGDAELAHAPRILRPPVFRPVFRIVANAEHPRSAIQ
jgi:hypothetical protein